MYYDQDYTLKNRRSREHGPAHDPRALHILRGASRLSRHDPQGPATRPPGALQSGLWTARSAAWLSAITAGVVLDTAIAAWVAWGRQYEKP